MWPAPVWRWERDNWNDGVCTGEQGNEQTKMKRPYLFRGWNHLLVCDMCWSTTQAHLFVFVFSFAWKFVFFLPKEHLRTSLNVERRAHELNIAVSCCHKLWERFLVAPRAAASVAPRRQLAWTRLQATSAPVARGTLFLPQTVTLLSAKEES